MAASNDISSQTASWIEPEIDGRHHRDSELLKSFRSDIQDGRHGGQWNSSNNISSQTLSRIKPKLDGRHHSDTEIQNC